MAIVTIAPRILMATPNQEVFLIRALEKTQAYILAGRKPLLLLGDEARDKYLPHIKGSMKRFQGHMEEIQL